MRGGGWVPSPSPSARGYCFRNNVPFPIVFHALSSPWVRHASDMCKKCVRNASETCQTCVRNTPDVRQPCVGHRLETRGEVVYSMTVVMEMIVDSFGIEWWRRGETMSVCKWWFGSSQSQAGWTATSQSFDKNRCRQNWLTSTIPSCATITYLYFGVQFCHIISSMILEYGRYENQGTKGEWP